MAHFFHVSSHRCEASVCLLGQLTVFQDTFLMITRSHYRAISAANGDCGVESRSPSRRLPPTLSPASALSTPWAFCHPCTHALPCLPPTAELAGGEDRAPALPPPK